MGRAPTGERGAVVSEARRVSEARYKGIAVLALAGLFISGYLLLYKLGVYGELMCGAGGGCDIVQASRWASFLGLPVAGWGTAWYAAAFGLAIVGVRGAPGERPWPAWGLLGLAVAGTLFSAYLTYIELFVLRAICRWCVASAVLTVLILLLAIPRRGA